MLHSLTFMVNFTMIISEPHYEYEMTIFYAPGVSKNYSCETLANN